MQKNKEQLGPGDGGQCEHGLIYPVKNLNFTSDFENESDGINVFLYARQHFCAVGRIF